MPHLKHYIYTLLATFTIIFSSCQKSDLIGLDEANDADATNITTSAVDISTVREDSVVTVGIAQHPFGYLKDPVLGPTEANIALTFNLPSSTTFSFGTGATIDSVVLSLKYGDEFYGDTTISSTYSIKVAELDTVFGPGTYYSNRRWKNTGSVGTKQVKGFYIKDSVSVEQKVDGKKDTAKTIAPHLRIKLDAASLFTKLKNALTLDSTTNTGFQKNFKGLYLTIDKNASTGLGGITFFDLASSGNISGLEVYYTNRTATGALDTNMVLFPTTAGLAASSVVQPHDPAIVAKEGSVDVSQVYVQPLAGYRAKVKFTQLDALKALAGNSASEGKAISINRAELIVPEIGVTQGTLGYLSPSPRLTLYRTDIAGVRQPLPDNAVGMDPRYLSEPLFGGFYNSAKREYRFVVTSYIQDLLTGKLKEFETYIAPTRKIFTGTANINASATTAGRAILPGNKSTGPKVRLSIIYTKPD